MNFFHRNNKVVFLNDLQIQAGKSEGLTPLTNEQLEKHLSSDYEFDGSDFVEVTSTYEDELTTVNSEYDKDIAVLSLEYNVAVARDGSTETVKVEAIRERISARDTRYEEDQETLIIKYFGE